MFVRICALLALLTLAVLAFAQETVTFRTSGLEVGANYSQRITLDFASADHEFAIHSAGTSEYELVKVAGDIYTWKCTMTMQVERTVPPEMLEEMREDEPEVMVSWENYDARGNMVGSRDDEGTVSNVMAIFPAVPVKVGDNWRGHLVDEDGRSDIDCTLTDVRTIDGVRYAVIAYETHEEEPSFTTIWVDLRTMLVVRMEMHSEVHVDEDDSTSHLNLVITTLNAQGKPVITN